MPISRATSAVGLIVPSNAANCPFCEIVQLDDPDAREVYRDDHVVAFFPLEPATLGHTLVVPREHVQDIWGLKEETASRLALVTVRLANVMRGALRPEGLNVIQSNGEVATQTVPHLHVHLVPRWRGDAVGRIWPPETNYTEDQKDVAWEKLRAACRKEMLS
ncbi:HIT family protein [Arthrobacter sp. FW306-06-A]|uniref:HIT family protein n=1 Tax=Arthrobacter sp. FW306-06-A TaxID=2879621 RepID=UPI001F43BC3C|nr:HIT domain-containing protein [Arthrobacter sp. FW306-06-A]UKA73594.1 HIT domain-containing protein [Arthrobacter sp. FW306-06-A]